MSFDLARSVTEDYSATLYTDIYLGSPTGVPTLRPPTQMEVESVQTDIAVRGAAGAGAGVVGSTVMTVGLALSPPPITPVGAAVVAVGALIMAGGAVLSGSAATADPEAMLIRRQLRESGYSRRFARLYAKALMAEPADLHATIDKFADRNSKRAREQEQVARAVLYSDTRAEARAALESAHVAKQTAAERTAARLRAATVYVVLVLVLCLAVMAIMRGMRTTPSTPARIP